MSLTQRLGKITVFGRALNTECCTKYHRKALQAVVDSWCKIQVIVRTKMGQELNEHARAKGLLEFRDVPENNLEKLKKVSMNKKRMAIKNLTEKSGSPHDLLFLNRNDPVFSSL